MPQPEDIIPLFETRSIQEILAIEENTRVEIENKKQELRQMVGQSYRDIIDAADTIRDMKFNAEKMEKQISDIDSNINFTNSIERKNIFTAKDLEDIEKIKIYMNLPSCIWKALSSRKFIIAAQLYLIMKDINSHINENLGHILKNVPILYSQSLTLVDFRNIILDLSRATLKSIKSDIEILSESLCAIILLENLTCRQLLREYLVGRTNALQNTCKVDVHSTSVKCKINDIILLLVNSLHQIYVIFSNDKYDSFLLNKLSTLTDINSLVIKLNEYSCEKYATFIVENASSHLSDMIPVTANDLKNLCNDWFSANTKLITNNISSFLTYLESIKTVASITDSIWDLLKKNENFHLWSTICNAVLGYEVCIWRNVLSDIFQERIEKILEKFFDDLLENNRSFLDDCEKDVDIPSYVWTEELDDIGSNCAWSTPKSLTIRGNLVMKTRAYTPLVQGFCKYINASVQRLLEDMEYFLKKKNKRYDDDDNGGIDEVNVFDKFSLNELLTKCLIDLVDNYIKSFINELNKTLKSIEKSDENWKEKIIFLGRLADSIIDLCPAITECLLNISEDEAYKFLKQVTKSKNEKFQNWFSLNDLLHEFYLETLNLWVCFIIEKIITEFQGYIRNNDATFFIFQCTKWDEVLMEEKSEDDEKTVSTKIHVPMMASWYVQEMLFKLRKYVLNVGGQALPKIIIRNLTEKLWKSLLGGYKSVLENVEENNQIKQVESLQMIFDLQFLNLLFCKEKEPLTEYKDIISELEKHVDPFDLAVFVPLMNQHLQKQFHKYKLIYAIFIGKDLPTLESRYLQSSSTTPGTDQHNIVSLNSTNIKFPLLPVSMVKKSEQIEFSEWSSSKKNEEINKNSSSHINNNDSFLEHLPWFGNFKQ